MDGWIDAHCHLADPRWGADLAAVMRRAAIAGAIGFLQGGVDLDDWRRQRELVGPVYRCFGVHPWTAARLASQELREMLARLPDFLDQALALGELGLDRSKQLGQELAWNKQILAFEAQLELAQSWRLPVVLHVVHAHGEVLDRLRRKPPPVGGLVHGFCGSLETARQYWSLGLAISLGTAVTRPGFTKLKRAVPFLPPEALVVESDAPERGPEGWSGERGEPAALPLIAAAIAAYRGETGEQVLARSSANLARIFGLRRAT